MHLSPTSKEAKQAFLTIIDTLHRNPTSWEWVPCPFFLKTIPQQNLTSYINLNPFQKSLDSIVIYFDKPLNYHAKLGWNWHKSWILPELTVQSPCKSPSKRKSFVKVFAVKVGLEYSENFFLEDIGVKGCSKEDFQQRNTSFRNLKFSTTSYNNEGLKFHLIVAIFEEQDENSMVLEADYNIIEARMSPPIYVDSRKSGRELLIKDYSELGLFNPEIIQTALYNKRRRHEEEKKEVISNSLKGFLGYYTAANIRNKVLL